MNIAITKTGIWEDDVFYTDAAYLYHRNDVIIRSNPFVSATIVSKEFMDRVKRGVPEQVEEYRKILEKLGLENTDEKGKI